MNPYVHLLRPFPLITQIDSDVSRLRKTTVGSRCDQKTLLQRFLAQPDGQHGLRPCAANAAQFSSSQFLVSWFPNKNASLCALRDLCVQNSYPWLSV
jgi:hypothetical protein